jgi:putative alpha-1,2-mannosidase
MVSLGTRMRVRWIRGSCGICFGLYPVVTQPVYLILAPWFSEITMPTGEGNTLRITAKNPDASKGYVFAQSVKVNGKNWNKS